MLYPPYLGAQNAVQCKKKTNKQTYMYNSKTDQSNASINKWDLRLVLKVSN